MKKQITQEDIARARRILREWITASAGKRDAREKCEHILRVIEGLSTK